jgi:enterochelin esterase-like enzyme
MQDGQNVFHHPSSAILDTWQVNTVMEALVAEGAIEPWIIVGVDSGPGRLAEYSPWDEPRAGIQARGNGYADFFLEALQPFVEKHYRVRSEASSTAVVGSSLGGLISLYFGWRYGDRFGRVGAFSPSVMWSQGLLQEHWRERTPHPVRLYIDAGEAEHLEAQGVTLNYGEAVRAFGERLMQGGHPADQLRVVLEPNGRHHELDWRRRLPGALRWLLAK